MRDSGALACSSRRAVLSSPLPPDYSIASFMRLLCAGALTIPQPDEAHTGPERLEMVWLTQDGDQASRRQIRGNRTSGCVLKRRTRMRGFLILVLLMVGTTANAHPGHWADVAGHDHWIAGAAIGLAGIAAIWGALKGKKAKDETEEEPEELEEETA